MVNNNQDNIFNNSNQDNIYNNNNENNNINSNNGDNGFNNSQDNICSNNQENVHNNNQNDTYNNQESIYNNSQNTAYNNDDGIYNNNEGGNYNTNSQQEGSTIYNQGNYQNYGYTSYQEVKGPQIPETNYYAPIKPKKKPGRFKKALSYIIVGLICTTIGGAASGAAILYVLPKTNFYQNAGLVKTAGDANNSTPVYSNHPTQLASTGGAMTVAEIANKVGPAVVAITSTVQGQTDFFGNSSPSEAVGSGMIISKDGYILTNYHVVEGGQQIKVILSNGKTVNAKVVNYDANYDVAVVKITDKVDVPAVAELGESSSLQVGESVVAIGNPLGTDFMGSVTSGIVSALNRKLSGDPNNLSYIQTDAAINSGNSGGPLINSRGQVVGINTAKIKESGVEGLGFAIPIDAVKSKIPDLSKPILMIGIQGREVDKDTAAQYNLPVGVYVQDITQFSPAEKAGLQRGDVIVKFDGQKVATFNDLNTIKNKHKAGDQVSVTVVRDGKEQNLTLKLTE